MDIVGLRTLSTVVRTGSMTRAADVLNCVPSAVTQRLKSLETEVGRRLVARQRSGVVPTPAGRVLLRYAEDAVRLFDEAARALQDDAQPAGTLKVGVTDTAATVYLPPVFARYHETHPEVALEITSSVTSELISMVREHALDCAIVNGTIDDPALRFEHVRTERLVLVSARTVDDPYAANPVTFLAAREGGRQRQRIEEWWAARGGPAMRILTLPSIGHRLSFAAAGVGVTVMPVSALGSLPGRDSIRLHPLEEPWCWQETAFVTRQGAFPMASERAFRDVLRAEFG